MMILLRLMRMLTVNYSDSSCCSSIMTSSSSTRSASGTESIGTNTRYCKQKEDEEAFVTKSLFSHVPLLLILKWNKKSRIQNQSQKEM